MDGPRACHTKKSKSLYELLNQLINFQITWNNFDRL